MLISRLCAASLERTAAAWLILQDPHSVLILHWLLRFAPLLLHTYVHMYLLSYEAYSGNSLIIAGPRVGLAFLTINIWCLQSPESLEA